MNIAYFRTLAFASVLVLGLAACSNSTSVESLESGSGEVEVTDPCAGANPCAAINPCASGDPCAGADPCASVSSGVDNEATLVSYFIEDGVAIRGADPVAYFTQGEAVIGTSEFEYEWNGATWRFSSAENRDLFASTPENYAPQYGGYCAWAVSQGYTAPVDPTAWRIVDGKLYLNYDKRIQQRWEQDISGNITQANENWPGVLVQ